MGTLLKDTIKERLLSGDYAGIIELGKKHKGVLRSLISLTYDKGELICWRAIEAVGFLSAGMGPAAGLDAIDRLFVMMRDESGGNPWSAPEMIGEIIKHDPSSFSYLLPVLVSFRDEALFAAGILHALAGLAPSNPELVMPYREMAFLSLRSGDPAVRANAILVMKSLSDDTYASSVAMLAVDEGRVVYYDRETRTLSSRSVGEIARQALESLRKTASG
ncbi:MAG: hypothetical protein M0Z75_04970 [Nitrospiraceae bacterium]|nr:hypothetical protein [Nitrospiraceae bacterium]